ncbi:MAG: hypothetical protein NXY59_01070 [Aigarchaeota archaeon]|nr:hypothetical protein [Candidatus Pelearchaeum maunauluense]
MYRYDFQGMVNIHCNTDILEKDFAFFHTDNSYLPRIELYIDQINPPENIRVSIGKSYLITDDGIFFSYRWVRPVNLWLRGVESDITRIVGTRMYYFLGNLVKSGYELMSLFRAVFTLKLLRRSFCLLPAAVDFSGKGVLIVGISNTGKTSTTLSLMSLDKESKYITDQFVVCGSNAICYGLPNSMLISRSAADDFQIKLGFSKTVKSYIKSLASWLLTKKLVNNKTWVSPCELFPRENNA